MVLALRLPTSPLYCLPPSLLLSLSLFVLRVFFVFSWLHGTPLVASAVVMVSQGGIVAS